MNVKRLVDELIAISEKPHREYVRISGDVGNLTFRFTPNKAYYYPEGIRAIYLQRAGGAGILYVYTTEERYPHLSVPFDGQNIHWTIAVGDRRPICRAPECIKQFINLFR